MAVVKNCWVWIALVASTSCSAPRTSSTPEDRPTEQRAVPGEARSEHETAPKVPESSPIRASRNGLVVALAPIWARDAIWYLGEADGVSALGERVMRVEYVTAPKASPFFQVIVDVFQQGTACELLLGERVGVVDGSFHMTGPAMTRAAQRAIGDFLNDGDFPAQCPRQGLDDCPHALIVISYDENLEQLGDRSSAMSYVGHPDTERLAEWVEAVVQTDCDPSKPAL